MFVNSELLVAICRIITVRIEEIKKISIILTFPPATPPPLAMMLAITNGGI